MQFYRFVRVISPSLLIQQQASTVALGIVRLTWTYLVGILALDRLLVQSWTGEQLPEALDGAHLRWFPPMLWWAVSSWLTTRMLATKRSSVDMTRSLVLFPRVGGTTHDSVDLTSSVHSQHRTYENKRTHQWTLSCNSVTFYLHSINAWTWHYLTKVSILLPLSKY